MPPDTSSNHDAAGIGRACRAYGVGSAILASRRQTVSRQYARGATGRPRSRPVHGRAGNAAHFRRNIRLTYGLPST